MAPTPMPRVDEGGALPPTDIGGAAASAVGNDPAVLIGHVIAERYRVEAVLGRGGMGAVLRCHHLGLRRDVAVKLLHPEIAADPEISARFEREATSASRLDHPNCVRVLDFGLWQPAPGGPTAKYLAMQLLDGCELADLLGKPLPPARAIGLIQQVLAALEHAHAQGVVHRDLKPENIFVTRDHDGAEVLKLVDFGIAKITEGDGASAKLTRMGVVFGTPRYMSPEQAAGGVVDLRSDLYATGVILYELLSGLPPFVSDDPMTLLRSHLFEAPPALSDALPHELRAIVLRLLEKDRNDRFASATEVRAALAACPLDVAAGASAASTSASLPGHSTLPNVAAGTMPPASSGTMPPVSAGTMRVAPVTMPTLARGGLTWRHAAGITAVAVAVVAIVAIAKRGDSEPTPAKVDALIPVPAPSVVGAPAPRNDAPAGPFALPPPGLTRSDTAPATAQPSAALAEVDALLARGEAGRALTKLDSEIALRPDDAQLHVRRARALTDLPKRQADALEAYRRALANDPKLLDDRDVIARLYPLVRAPALRVPAAELVLTSMGATGLPLLVEFVQAPAPLLPYDLRHRALAAIEASEAHAASIDRGLQQSLDLWQAARTEAPCARFAEALDAIEREPTPGVLGTLHRVTPPVAPEGANEETRTLCLGLPARLVAVRTTVLAAHPVPAAQWTVPPAYADVGKKKKRRGVFGRLFGG